MARERNLLTVLAAFFLLLAVSFLGNGDGNAEVVKLESDVNVTLGFSPNGGITENIVKAISEEEIGDVLLVEAYSFTSKPIYNALIAAKQRGVDVRILLDRGQEKNKSSGWIACAKAGTPVLFDAKHAIAHNKVLVFVGKGVGFGSFNFSSQAEEKNAENYDIVWSKVLSKRYEKEWYKLKGECRNPIVSIPSSLTPVPSKTTSK